MRTWILGATVAVAITIVGCGGSTSSTAPGSARPTQGAAATTQANSYTLPADVCTLLTPDDIKAQFGGAYLAVVATETSAVRTDCLWSPASASASPGAVELTVMPVIEELWKGDHASAKNIKVEGLGDAAHYNGAAQGALEARAGDTLLRFSVKRGSLSQANADAGVLALARIAFGRL